ncbi:MAG TPA: hypothetical protein GX507_07525 [Clostridia bacterium]|nr:hypothetical protein [Clostridia bacterium]
MSYLHCKMGRPSRQEDTENPENHHVGVPQNHRVEIPVGTVRPRVTPIGDPRALCEFVRG